MPDIASLFVFPLMLILFRIGSCVMVFPGLSDIAVNTRARMSITFVVSLAMFAMLEPQMPSLPSANSALIAMVLVEIAIGIMMGISAKLFSSALHVGGEMISFTSGLQAATMFDPSAGGNSTAPSLFLGLIGGVLIFATNLHHFIFMGLIESYRVFPVGTLPALGDTAQAVTRIVADMFLIGVKIAAPVVAVGFLGYIALGIFNRMIPQFQVFFVALPLTIYVGLYILSITLAGIVTLYSNEMFEHAILFEQDLEQK